MEICLPYVNETEELFRLYAYKAAGNIYFVNKLRENPKVIAKEQANQSNEYDFSPLYIQNGKFEAEFVGTLISYFMKGFDETSIICLRECLTSFQRLLDGHLFDLKNLKAILPDLSVKLRVCFESPDSKIRALGFSFYGKVTDIVAKGCVVSDESLLEEMYQNLISLFLHLSDSSEAVHQASLQALIAVSQALEKGELM